MVLVVKNDTESQSLLNDQNHHAANDNNNFTERSKKSTRGFVNSFLHQSRIATSGFVMFAILSSLILVSFNQGFSSVKTDGESILAALGKKKSSSGLGHKSHSHTNAHVIDVPFADDSDKHNNKASHNKKNGASSKK